MGTVTGIDRPTTRARQFRREATPAERLLWQYLSRSQLGVKFSRQMPVGPYVCDFLCRWNRLAVELDGVSHDSRSDTTRDAFIAAQGVHVLRFANRDVLANVAGVVAAIQIPLADMPTPGPSRRREGGR